MCIVLILGDMLRRIDGRCINVINVDIDIISTGLITRQSLPRFIHGYNPLTDTSFHIPDSSLSLSLSLSLSPLYT